MAANQSEQVCTHDFNPLDKADQDITPPKVEEVEEDTTQLLDVATGRDELEQADICNVLVTLSRRSAFHLVLT